MSRTPLPSQIPNGSFLVEDADSLGLSPKQLSRDGIFTPSRGIRLPLHSTGTVADNVRAYSRLDPTCVLTHSTSARICCICLPAWLDQDWRIHIARPANGCKPRRRNVVGHQLSLRHGEVMMLDGVRLTSPARTWLDLASLLSIDELVAAGDSIVLEHGEDFPMPRNPLATIEDLKGIIGRHPGMRGVRKARIALDLIRVGADSAQETMMRLALVRAGLPEPVLNIVLRNRLGHPVVWPDAAYLDQRIALQYDGAHHGDSDQYRRDIKRQSLTESVGWREVRVQRSDLEGDRPFIVEKVKAALRGPSSDATRERTGS
jgi:very-short-patch-repair endonuclease